MFEKPETGRRSPPFSDIFHAPFYARLPYKPALQARSPIKAPQAPQALSPSRRAGSLSAATPLRDAPSTMRHSTPLRPPVAIFTEPPQPARAVSFYNNRGIRLPLYCESVRPRQHTGNIRHQAALLQGCDAAEGPRPGADAGAGAGEATRVARAVKTEMLPNALRECARDTPCYAYLFACLTGAIERQKNPPPLMKKDDPVDPNIRRAGAEASAGVDAGVETLLERRAQESRRFSADILSLAKLVARRRLENEAYRRHGAALQADLLRVAKETDVARASLEAHVAEIARLESLRLSEADVKCSDSIKERLQSINSVKDIFARPASSASSARQQ